MFFTIVIPACNCEHTINRLLDSIKNQDIDREDFKVILCDDSYGEDHANLYDYVKPYEEFYNIEYYKREEEPYTIHCPGNTRHSGLSRALQEDTEYIMFIDADDKYEPNTLKILKDSLVQIDCPNVFGSIFNVYNMNDQLQYVEQDTLGWLHGKGYRKQFLKEHNIQFYVDLLTHEDTCFNCLVVYYLMLQHENATTFREFAFYGWYQQDGSFTRKNFDAKDELYIQKYFDNYCTSCIDVFMDPYKEAKITDREMQYKFITRIAHNIYMAYCYFQGFINRGKIEYLEAAYKSLRQRIWDYYKIFDVTKEDLVKIVYAEPAKFIENRNASYRGVGQYIERKSFEDFIYEMTFYK